MPKRSTVQELPADLKAWLDRELIKRGFSGYEELAAIIRNQGHQTSRSSLQRYGQQLQIQQDSIRASVEGAKAIVDVTDDREGALNQALISLVQTNLFNLLVEAEEVTRDPAKLAKLTRAISDLARADVNQKRFADEVRTKTKLAADAVKKITREGGLNKEQQDDCYKTIMGIVS